MLVAVTLSCSNKGAPSGRSQIATASQVSGMASELDKSRGNCVDEVKGGTTDGPPLRQLTCVSESNREGPFALLLSVPYVEYLEVELTPPPREGTNVFRIQNNTLEQLVHYDGGPVTLSVRANSTFGRIPHFVESGRVGNPLTVQMDGNRQVNVALVATGSDEKAAVYEDPIFFPEAKPRPGDFTLGSPAHNDVVHQSRQPVLSWPAVAGATSYRVYLNVTRSDYDFSKPGSLLDRYTLLGTTASTSFTPAALPDRWTYRWYVEAVTGAGVLTSEKRSFALYLPKLEQIDDGVGSVNGFRDLNKNGSIEPYENWTLPVETRIDDLISRMTIEEKAMQLFFVAESFPTAGWHFGPARPEDLIDFQKASARTRLGIPFISTGDTTHGYITSFPTGVGMAATRQPRLAYEAANMQRGEQVVAGYRGTLGPIAEVGTKVIYPRIQEGGGEDAELVAALMRAMIAGYQGGPELAPDSILATIKHWPGEGAGGEAGIVYDGVTINYHMKPFKGAIDAGTAAIMPGYAGSSFLHPGGPGAGDSIGILSYLREALSYDGLIMTDWLPSGAWIRAANAGSDVMGGANPSNIDMSAFIKGVDSNRLHKALRRILRVKFKLGLFENPYGEQERVAAVHHSDANVALSQRAAEASLTLLKNNNILPLRLDKGAKLLVTGPRATDGEALCIWRSGFQPLLGEKTIAQAIEKRATEAGLTAVIDPSLQPSNQGYAAAIVVVGERSYTHGTFWNKEAPYLPSEERGLIDYLAAQRIPIVLVYLMPRPYVITAELPQADAIAVAYRPGGSGGPAIARLLFGDIKPQGKLPFQLPRDMAQVGLDHYPESPGAEKWDLPFDLGASDAERTQIRDLIAADQHVPPTFGHPLFPYGAGYEDFHLVDASPPATPRITRPMPGQLFSSAPLFTWTASSDLETGIQSYELWLDGALRATTRATTFDARGLALSKGSHELIVRARNWAEQTTASSSVSFDFVDSVAPSAPQVIATHRSENHVLVTWLSAGDAESGMKEYLVRLNGQIVATLPAADRDVTHRNVARQAQATASSVQGDLRASFATDGDLNTRWGSESLDGQYISLDLGATYSLDRLDLAWEAAYARGYQIETSLDGASWQALLTVHDSVGGNETHAIALDAARHIRLTSLERGTGYGVSLWELGLMGRPVEQLTLDDRGDGTLTVEAVDRHDNRSLSAPFVLAP